MSGAHAVPSRLADDDDLAGRFKVRLAEALSVRMDESEWKKFSLLHGLADYITEHPRFLRSLKWDDGDHGGLVLDLVEHLYSRKPSALMELFERPAVQRWLKTNDRELLDLLDDPDPLITALSHGVQEVAAVSDVIDLGQYMNRVQSALPSDPHQAVGATKDMLEATMRTILRKRGEPDVDSFDFPALTGRCLTKLGLTPNSPPSRDAERHTRKIVSSARGMIEAANTLRNLAGTGHGRVVGEEEPLTSADASLVASTGLILAAWLLRVHAEAPV